MIKIQIKMNNKNRKKYPRATKVDMPILQKKLMTIFDNNLSNVKFDDSEPSKKKDYSRQDDSLSSELN